MTFTIPFLLSPSSSFAIDTDGDGLEDSWEINGYDYNNDGIIDVDLPGMGANPLRKDIFIEIDWMSTVGHNHKPPKKAIQKVIRAFATAPVSNPDLSQGITLHIDTGNEGGGNALVHDNDLNPVWTEFDAIKNTHFAIERHDIFHYAVFAHRYSGGCSSGLSRGISASDFIVSLGCWPGQVGTVREQAGTLMHELGHNLALRHGGDDNVNYKPNFLSVMNYFFQLRGLYKKGIWGKIDYSRFLMKDLNEKKGLGLVGTGDRVLRKFGTRAYCPNGSVQTITNSRKRIDWDCDGNNSEPSVSVDINRSFFISTLRGQFNGWDNLVCNGGLIGLGTTATLPMDG